MRQTITKDSFLVRLTSVVWYKKAQFVVTRLYRNKSGKKMAELSPLKDGKYYMPGDVLAPVDDLKESYTPRYAKEKTDENNS